MVMVMLWTGNISVKILLCYSFCLICVQHWTKTAHMPGFSSWDLCFWMFTFPDGGVHLKPHLAPTTPACSHPYRGGLAGEAAWQRAVMWWDSVGKCRFQTSPAWTLRRPLVQLSLLSLNCYFWRHKLKHNIVLTSPYRSDFTHLSPLSWTI